MIVSDDFVLRLCFAHIAEYFLSVVCRHQIPQRWIQILANIAFCDQI